MHSMNTMTKTLAPSILIGAALAGHPAFADDGAWTYDLVGTEVRHPSLVAAVNGLGGSDGWDDLLVGSASTHTVASYGWDPNGETFGGTAGDLINESAPGNGIVEPRKLVPADLNLDGKQDFLVVSIGRDQLAWYTQGETTSWNVIANQFNETSICSALDAVVADLNGDGSPDIALVDGTGLGCSSNLSWYSNEGSGTFVAEGIVATVPGLAPGFSEVEAADLDGDGDIDLITSGGSITQNQGWNREVIWFENDGFGTFTMREQLIGRNNPISPIAVIDLDGDGDNDVVGSEGSAMWCVENLGNGSFHWQGDLLAAPNTFVNWVNSDLDNDGDIDFVGVVPGYNPGPSYYELWWWENLGDFTFSSNQFMFEVDNAYVVEQILAHDFDGDGLPDIVAALNQNSFSGSGQVAWWKNGLCEVDCNDNGISDCTETASGFAQDCNGNHTPDACDIASGNSLDENGDGVPDECQECPADLNGDNTVDGADLTALLAEWGTFGTQADLNGDGFVDGADLTALLSAWGACN